MAAMPHRVLLADDDRAIRESLDLEGYHVTEVREIALTHGGARPGGGAVIGFVAGADLLLPNFNPDHVDG